MGTKIHSFWIEGELTKHQLLTVHSFLRHGHEFELYAYEPPEGLPASVKVGYLGDFVPPSDVYHYRHMGHSRRLGGISERVKAEMLYQLGGWHVDMDVTCLRYFDFTSDYVLRPHTRVAVGNIIKCPPRSELARIFLEGALAVDEHNTDFEKSFLGLGEGVRSLSLEQHIVADSIFGRDDGDWQNFLRAAGQRPGVDQYAIHWCGALGRIHDSVEPGSFYDSLMKEYGLS